MGVNLVKLGDEVIVDLTGDSVSPGTLANGETAHDASGNPIVGTMPVDVVRHGKQTLTDAQKAQARENIGAVGIGAITDEIETEVENQLDGAKAGIVAELIEQLGGLPVFGTVDDDKIVTVTSALGNGTYVLRYKDADGAYSELCTFVINNGEPEESNTYEVDIAAIGYSDNARWSTTDGTIRTNATGFTAINLIPFERASGQTMTVTLSGITWVEDGLSSNAAWILMYVDNSFTSGHNMPIKNLPKNYLEFGTSGVLNDDGTVTITIKDGTNGIMYNGFKVCGVGSGANAKITITIE